MIITNGLISGIDDWNEQLVFNWVVAHLAVQRSHCDRSGTSLYHGSDGKACAFGSLIPINATIPEGKSLDDFDIPELVDVIPELAYLKGKERLCCYLAGVHDCFSVDEWDAQLRHTAKLFNLSDDLIDVAEF